MCQKLTLLQTFDVILGKLCMRVELFPAKTFFPRCSMHNLMEPHKVVLALEYTLIFALHAMFSLKLSQWDMEIDFFFTPLRLEIDFMVLLPTLLNPGNHLDFLLLL